MRILIISLHLISFCHENPKICEINHSSQKEKEKKKPKEGEENISQKGEEKRKKER